MNKVYLVFGIHNFQPPGLPGSKYEEYYQQYYKKMLVLLNEYRDVPAVLHFSGTILEWMDTSHTEYLDLLSEMVKRKQIELLSGAFYDPILPLIPNSDKLGQIEKLTTYLRKHFGKKPRGCWITKMAWEPSLAYTLKNSGMDYTILNDNQLSREDWDLKDSYYSYITEDQGKAVTVFLNSSELTKLFISGQPEELVSRIKLIAESRENSVIVVFVPGESIGGENSELFESFLRLLRRNRDWLVLQNPLLYLKTRVPKKRIYIPGINCDNSSGFFRYYLTQYPDINLIYSRMIHTNILVNQVRGDKYKKRAARNELWKGQSNSVYWNAENGGIFFNRLRKSTYRSFLEAEKITRTDSGFIPSIITLDFDMDGRKEFLYQGKVLNAYVHQKSGAIIELDYLPSSWNYLDTIDKKYTNMVKSNDTDLRYSAKAFIDHFMVPGESLENFKTGGYVETGDFAGSTYNVVDINKNRQSIQFVRTGKVEFNGAEYPLRVEKKYTFRQNTIYIYYTLTNLSDSVLDLNFGVEINLSLSFADKPDYDLSVVRGDAAEEINVNRGQEIKEVESVNIIDNLNTTLITLFFADKCILWSFPVSYMGMYQYTCFMPVWEISLQCGETVKKDLSVKLKRL